MTFNIYVPSYKRYNSIMTQDLLEYCTYVVRKSEEDKYREAGVKSLISVDDGQIDSCEKVHNWIIDNTAEDVVCVFDDDAKSFAYRLEVLEKGLTPETVTAEVERLAQLIYDLDIGYCASPSDMNVKFYSQPFKFVGVTSGMKIYNKSALKTRFKDGLKFLSDIEFQMEELLKNRVILIPEYFCSEYGIDTNAGGNNANKSMAMFKAENEIMKNKWGKYYKKADDGKAGSIKVKR